MDVEDRLRQQRDAGVYECQVNTEPKMNLASFESGSRSGENRGSGRRLREEG
uniref:GK13676 gene product from transcript GK13676-RA n=1 Tax=Apis cerana TaxID=7461 RepID=V9ID26_APICE